VTMATTSESKYANKGLSYVRVAKAVKPSDKLAYTQLAQRSGALRDSLDTISGGAPVAQMAHFINKEKALMQHCLEKTWLSPPRELTLDDCLSLKKEMSGAMYDSITAFIREKTGAKVVARKEVLQAFDDFAFEYETGSFTSVDEKEVEVKGKKVKKKVTSHGSWLRVKDPMAVVRQSAQVHARAGRMAWGGNVPANVYPLVVMIDAGGGITKVVLKHPCIARADSVRSLSLLGMLIGVKDTYAAMKEAFGPIYDALSRINDEDTYVTLPWAPRLPTLGTWELSGEAKLPTCISRFLDVRTVLNM